MESSRDTRNIGNQKKIKIGAAMTVFLSLIGLGLVATPVFADNASTSVEPKPDLQQQDDLRLTESVIATLDIKSTNIAIHESAKKAYVVNNMRDTADNLHPFSIKVIDTTDYSVVSTIDIPRAISSKIIIDEINKRAYFLFSNNNRIGVIDTEKDEIIHDAYIGSSNGQLVVYPSKKLLYLVDREENTLFTFPTKNDDFSDDGFYESDMHNTELKTKVSYFAVNENTNRGYMTENKGGTIHILDLETNSEIGSFGNPIQFLIDFVVDSNSNKAYSISPDYLNVIVLDSKQAEIPIDVYTRSMDLLAGAKYAATDRVEKKIPIDVYTRSMDINFKTQRAYLVGDGEIEVVDLKTKASLGSLKLPIGWSPDAIAVDESANKAFVVDDLGKSFVIDLDCDCPEFLDEMKLQAEEFKSNSTHKITKITNPKSVLNWEYYEINTECELKYFLYKDPTKTSEIYNLIRQNEQRMDQEYFARANEMGDKALLMEIVAEIIMEQYSINPILKDSVVFISDQALPQEEIQQIQQGTHTCEEEFKTYSNFDSESNVVPTVRSKDDAPEFGLKAGQWTKYKISFDNDSKEYTNIFTKSMTRISGPDIELEDIEWIKIEVVDVNGDQITSELETSVRGKSTNFFNTQTYTYDPSQIMHLFIPVDTQENQLLTRDEFLGDIVSGKVVQRSYGGERISTIPLSSNIEFKQTGMHAQADMDSFYDKETGMLLEYNLDVGVATFSEGFAGKINLITIDRYVPSAKTSDIGGGCLITTAIYGSELAPQVQQLRELRDTKLLQTEAGTLFMNSFNEIYYSFSPIIADYERENPLFKEAVKIAITPMISSLSILNYVDINSEIEVLGYGISLIILNVGMYFVAPAIILMGIIKRF